MDRKDSPYETSLSPRASHRGGLSRRWGIGDQVQGVLNLGGWPSTDHHMLTHTGADGTVGSPNSALHVVAVLVGASCQRAASPADHLETSPPIPSGTSCTLMAMRSRKRSQGVACPVCEARAEIVYYEHFVEERAAPVNRTLDLFTCPNGCRPSPEQLQQLLDA